MSPNATKPLGRPVDLERREKLRRAIVKTALKAFIKDGFRATRLADIAARNDIAKSTLYLYFKDKEALFAAVLRDTSRPFVDADTPQLAEGETVGDFVRRVVAPAFKALDDSDRSKIIQIVWAEGSQFPAIADAYYRDMVQPELSRLQKLMQIAVERGELSSDILVRYPFFVVAGPILGMMWNRLYLAAEPVDQPAAVDAYLDLLFPKS